MSIDEAIEFSKYKSNQHHNELEGYEYDANEHEQIVEWLNELKELRKWKEQEEKACDKFYQQGRADAIDDCVKTVHDYFGKLLGEHEEWEIDSIDDYALVPNKNICEALKQLKEKKNE